MTDFIFGVLGLILLWQQNQIFKKQNMIFAEQAGKLMQPEVAIFERVKRLWPMLVMVLLSVIIWGGIFYKHYSESAHFPAEFDSPENFVLLLGYGKDSPNSCFGVVDTKPLIRFQSEYKLAIGCFLWDGTTDRLDAPYVQVSNVYDIKEGNLNMRLAWGESFERYRSEQHATGILVALFLIPNSTSIGQFSTLRQARALGVHIPSVALAKSN